MNMCREENSPYCYFHPKEAYVGVCPLCLNERLLVLASNPKHKHSSPSSSSSSSSSTRRSNLYLPKLFAFGSFLNRLELRHRRFDPDASSTSHEDSFISIKFEDNGNALWEKNAISKVATEKESVVWNNHDHNHNHDHNRALTKALSRNSNKSVIEHQKTRSALRWRKRIGHLFQLIRLRSSTSCHVASKVEGVKVRKQGWMMRTLIRRKTKK